MLHTVTKASFLPTLLQPRLLRYAPVEVLTADYIL